MPNNPLGTNSVLEAIALIRDGTMIALDNMTSPRSPRIEGAQPPYTMTMWTRFDNVITALKRAGVANAPGVNVEYVHTTMHVGTHIDALGHFTCGDHAYGNKPAAALVGDHGLKALAAESIPPRLCKGVLFDLPAHGIAPESGRAIQRSDLERIANKDGLSLDEGNAVLIRTGWGPLYTSDPSRYSGSWPGLGLEAAEWLSSYKPWCIGADNMAVEVFPYEQRNKVMPVHQLCLVQSGIYLIENLNLEELARSRKTHFCLALFPIRYRGATASPIRPVAIL